MIKDSIVARECPCCGSKNLEKSSAILMPFVAHRALGWKPATIDETWGLRTIPKGIAYSICNSVVCNKCSFLFLDLRFSDSELAHLYTNYRGRDYVQLREQYEPGYSLRNELLENTGNYIPQVENFLKPFLSPKCRVLDWGGDTGKNTPFRDNNSLLHIYDISHREVIPGAVAIDKKTAQTTSYDLIVCSHVLEHLPWPAQTLLEIRACMQKETILYLELPCEELVRNSKSGRELLDKKRHWHEHINFFSESSIKELLERLDLKTVHFKTTEVKVADQNSWVFQVVCKK